MPPSYKPLPVTLQGAPDVFSSTPVDFFDARKLAESLATQDLNNEIQSINLERQRQAFDQEQQQREELKAQFGSPGAEVDPEKALRIAQRIALKNGDIDTAINAERSLRTYSGARREQDPLSSGALELARSFGVPLPDGASVTPEDLKAVDALVRAQSYSQQMPSILEKRRNEALISEQRASGIRPPTASQANMIAGVVSFNDQLDALESGSLAKIPEGVLARDFSQVDPNSEASLLQNRLKVMAKQAALALEDRVTDQDMQVLENVTTIGPLDKLETVREKFRYLRDFINTRGRASMEAMGAAGFRTQGFKDLLGGRIKTRDGGGGTPDLSAEEEAFKNEKKAQYLAKLRAGGG